MAKLSKWFAGYCAPPAQTGRRTARRHNDDSSILLDGLKARWEKAGYDFSVFLHCLFKQLTYFLF